MPAMLFAPMKSQLPYRFAHLGALLGLLSLALSACPTRSPVPNQEREIDANPLAPRKVPPKIILLIGDGMGRAQTDAASLFLNGQVNTLHMFDLPGRGVMVTSSPNGITDSAASATAMATGEFTLNGRVGLDLDGQPVQNLVELAKIYGLSTGVVSTTRIAHATPACFTAHVNSRGQYEDIAKQMAALRPNVILGGGVNDFEHRRDGVNLSEQLEDDGYRVVHTGTELSEVSGGRGDILGLFAPSHIPYVVDRGETTDVPTLPQMALAALERLDDNPNGFFLMIEGGRIDHAGHANHIQRNIGETIAFDQTVKTVMDWAQGDENVTILVTADHETGGLKVLQHLGIGEVPEVTWRWGSHTNTTIRTFSSGPGSSFFDGYVRDHRWTHAVLASLISDKSITPFPTISPNGHLEDLIGPSIAQIRSNADDPSIALTRLTLAADARGLGIGLEGLYRWDRGSTVILIDIDYGLATGLRTLDPLHDTEGAEDIFLSNLKLPALEDNGFGADIAFVTTRGQEPKIDQILPSAGLRGLRAPYGEEGSLGAMHAASNFADLVRSSGEATEVIESRGLEVFIRWEELYPGRQSAPANAQIAVWAVQLNEDGSASNQSLPPWPSVRQDRAPAPLVISP